MSSSLRRSALAVTALIAIIGAAFASSASAFPFEEARVAIPGNPLTVYVGQRGQLQGFLSGSSSGIYFAPQEQVGDAGFFLAFPTGGATPPSLQDTVWGFDGAAGPHGLEEYEPFFQGPVTGTGSAASPFTQVTEYEAEGVEVAQTTTYVNGSTEFKLKWEVFNETASAVNFRALTAADFYFEGDDRGTGVFTQGPPRFIGGTNVDSGRSGGFVEVNGGASPPWSFYQEMFWPNIWTEAVQQAANPAVHFNDTVQAVDEDNAGGVEWDQYENGSGLPSGGSATFELIARLATPAALQLNPTNAGSPQGVPVQITATALDSVGQPYAGRTLRYSITGANPGTGALTLDPSGKAVITDPGTHAGGDTIAAFVDFNNDGIREPNEPQASALATFIDSIPASCKVSVKGDRPGGGGGAGSALVISVNCSEAATMTVQTTLIPPGSGAKKSSASTSMVHKGKKKKQKPIVLPKTKATVSAGVSTPVSIKVPKSVAKKYAGKTLTAKVVATVRDAAGNVSKAQTTSKVKIAPAKKTGKGKGHHGH